MKGFGWVKPALRLIKAPFTAPVKAVERKVQSTMLEIIKGLVRHLLTAAGGALVTSGLLSADDLNAAIGAVVVLAGVILSAIKNKQNADAVPPAALDK